MTKTQTYDFAIIGGGIFGIYAAIYLAEHGLQVALIEKEQQLLQKASIVNQARLHGGYHYPRSVATARMSDENKARFTQDHQAFINFQFEKYYGIDRYGSFTDSRQFKRFCDYIKIPCEEVTEHPLFNYERLEAVFKTVEYTFDPILIAEFYKKQLKKYTGQIQVLLHHQILKAEQEKEAWMMELKNLEDSNLYSIQAAQVINATYSGSNAVNNLFGLRNIDLQHEISEIAFVSSPQFQNMGLTVMDGQFGSIMPYGLSGLLSLSSVAYTHHKVSYDDLPSFDCMKEQSNCSPDFLSICNSCPARPSSNYRKMLSQMRNYFSQSVQFNYYFSYFTVKSKLKANYIDDGRPTEISMLNEDPPFYCIFAGKINSIYEIEKILKL